MPNSKGAGKGAKADKPAKVNYTVNIDGTIHEVQSGGDVKDLVLETLADGQAHNITVVEVPEPAEEPEVEEEETPETPTV